MNKPTIHQIDTYRDAWAPKAATFGVGARNLSEIREATDARRELSRQQSPTAPVSQGDRHADK